MVFNICTCTAGAASFKENLDLLQVAKEKLDPSGLLIFAGDMNAFPGNVGGPRSTTPVNEQDRIPSRYIQTWGFMSVHLHLNDVTSSHTFETPLNTVSQSLEKTLSKGNTRDLLCERRGKVKCDTPHSPK